MQRSCWQLPLRRDSFLSSLPQLLTWEPHRDKDVAVVIVRPNFQDSVHVGYVTGLRKFTEYLTSVLCFTTPGDGPRSPPRAARTHEDSEFFIHYSSTCAEVLMIFRFRRDQARPSESISPSPLVLRVSSDSFATNYLVCAAVLCKHI